MLGIGLVEVSGWVCFLCLLTLVLIGGFVIAHGGLWLGLWFGVLRVFGDLRLVSLCGVIFDLQVTGCFGLGCVDVWLFADLCLYCFVVANCVVLGWL